MMQWAIEDRAGAGRVVILSGDITEEADFQSLAALDGGALRLDLGGIEQINSCGVREWIHFVRRLTHDARAFELLRCPPAIVRQLNTISNFRGGGAVRSVMLPYYCAGCGREAQRLLELPDRGPLPAIPETVACEQCGDEAEFDDLPDNYMAFAG